MITKYTAFRCPVDLLEKVKSKAKAQRRSLSNYLVLLIHNNTSDVPDTAVAPKAKAKAKARKK